METNIFFNKFDKISITNLDFKIRRDHGEHYFNMRAESISPQAIDVYLRLYLESYWRKTAVTDRVKATDMLIFLFLVVLLVVS